MKIFGHPVHAMLVHFPSALFPMEFLYYGIFYYFGNPTFAYAAFFSISTGVIFGWLALTSGLFDLMTIDRANKKVLKTALLHALLNTIVLICYTLLLVSELQHYPHYKEAGLAILIIKGILIFILAGGNFLGGKLVFNYNIGTKQQHTHE
ncbi:MAG: DUF2231 domain-containing protein [Balneolaceae bacterium]|nr:DUF2231 domain-containing protein [Balneolaceae bacterium]